MWLIFYHDCIYILLFHWWPKNQIYFFFVLGTYFVSWSQTEASSPGAVDPLSATSECFAALELLLSKSLSLSLPLTTRSTAHLTRPRCRTLALSAVRQRVGREGTLCCDWTCQVGGLSKEDLLLGQIRGGCYVRLLWLIAAAMLGTLSTAGHGKVGTDPTVTPVVSLHDPEEAGFAPERTPWVLHLPKLESWSI